MNRIGFCPGTDPPDESISEQLVLLPDSALDLTIRQRDELLSRGLGRPIPKIFLRGQQEFAGDDLVVHHSYTPFSGSTRHEFVRYREDGAIIFERHLNWEGASKPWFDGDDFLRWAITNSLRGVNIVSLLLEAKVIQLSLAVRGLHGCRLIFNPHHERHNTICEGSELIGRRETIPMSPRSNMVAALQKFLFEGSNKVLNSFQLPGHYESIGEGEFSSIFDMNCSRIKFLHGMLAERVAQSLCLSNSAVLDWEPQRPQSF